MPSKTLGLLGVGMLPAGRLQVFGPAMAAHISDEQWCNSAAFAQPAPCGCHAPPCRKGSAASAPLLPAYNPVAKEWQAPFIMEGVNMRVVQRSAALAGQQGGQHAYGSDFKYTETLVSRRGQLGGASQPLGRDLLGSCARVCCQQ
jgi:hypothetical protein